MVEKHPALTFLTHLFLVLGIIIICFPIYVAFCASTHPLRDLLSGPVPLFPGNQLLQNYKYVLSHGLASATGGTVAMMLWRSFIMAFLIAVGKIAISIISAFAIVYFRFPFRTLIFWLIFLTLMLPVEVRILPTYKVVADLHLLNTYAGLTLPLIASATATFLFRQFFLTIPDELTNAAKIDGAGPMQFFFHVLLPLSKTNIAALFIIMFVFGWNQYLWPLIATTQDNMSTIVMGMQRLASVADQVPQWHYIMATAILAMLPPVLIILLMQRLFVRGLIETEK